MREREVKRFLKTERRDEGRRVKEGGVKR